MEDLLNQTFEDRYHAIGEANGDSKANKEDGQLYEGVFEAYEAVGQANKKSRKATPIGHKDNPRVTQANPRVFEPYTSVGHANEQSSQPYQNFGSHVISIERYVHYFKIDLYCEDIVNTASGPEFPNAGSPFKWQIQAQWTVLNRIPTDPLSIQVQLELLMTRSPKKQPYWFYCITAYAGLENDTSMQTLQIFPDRPNLICMKNIVLPFVHFPAGLLQLYVHMQLQQMSDDKSLTPNFQHNRPELSRVRYASAPYMPGLTEGHFASRYKMPT